MPTAEWPFCSKRCWVAGPQVCESWAGPQVWAGGTWQLRNPSFRLRPALGECLARLAAAMPVAFLEPQLNEYNACSVYTTKSPRERASKLRRLGQRSASRSTRHRA